MTVQNSRFAAPTADALAHATSVPALLIQIMVSAVVTLIEMNQPNSTTALHRKFARSKCERDQYLAKPLSPGTNAAKVKNRVVPMTRPIPS